MTERFLLTACTCACACACVCPEPDRPYLAFTNRLSLLACMRIVRACKDGFVSQPYYLIVLVFARLKSKAESLKRPDGWPWLSFKRNCWLIPRLSPKESPTRVRVPPTGALLPSAQESRRELCSALTEGSVFEWSPILLAEASSWQERLPCDTLSALHWSSVGPNAGHQPQFFCPEPPRTGLSRCLVSGRTTRVIHSPLASLGRSPQPIISFRTTPWSKWLLFWRLQRTA